MLACLPIGPDLSGVFAGTRFQDVAGGNGREESYA